MSEQQLQLDEQAATAAATVAEPAPAAAEGKEADKEGGDDNDDDDDDDDESDGPMCRVCRAETTPDRPLFHPCICTGSIKYIHQDCLLQWLRVSKREYCELCRHKFEFKPIYSPDMPHRLPVGDIATSLLTSIANCSTFWLRHVAVASSWLLLVPLATCRMWRLMHGAGLGSLFSLRHLLLDCCIGGLISAVSLLFFVCIVWLREAIAHSPPHWLQHDFADEQQQQQQQEQQPQQQQQNRPPAMPGVLALFQFDHHLHQQPAAAQLGHHHQHHDDEVEEEEEGWLEEDEEGEDEVEANENDNQPDGDNLPAGDEQVAAAAAGEAADDEDLGAAAAAAAAAGAAAGGAAGQGDAVPEELNWERLLGFDGSLAFLQHVAWLLSLNCLFVLLLFTLPITVGRSVLAFGSKWCRLAGIVAQLPYISEGTSCGLGLACTALVIRLLHNPLASRRIRKLAGTAYLMVKLCLVLAILLTACPLACGVWLDAASLSLLNATVRDRQATFRSIPGAFLLVHWLLGLLWLVYSVIFFFLFVRDVFKPNLFNQLGLMPELDASLLLNLVRSPWLHTARSAAVLMGFFACQSGLILWLPAKLLHLLLPGFLPYRVSYSGESDLSVMELLLWQVVFPAVLDQGHVKVTLQHAVRLAIGCCAAAAGVKQQLLADVHLNQHHQQQPHQHQQQHQQQQVTATRLLLFTLALAAVSTLAATVCILCPVLIGRCLLRPFQLDSVNELYTAACGLYICWALLSMSHLIADWLPWNRAQVLSLLRQWAMLLAKMLVVGALYAVLSPLLLGILFEKVLLIPLRLPKHSSPVLNPFHCWFTGLILCKLITGCVFIGPNCRLKEALERIYEEGFLRVSFAFIWRELYLPVLIGLGLPLATPYVLVHACLATVTKDPRLLVEASRHVYCIVSATALLLCFVIYEVKQFRRFYYRLLNDRYLVGKRLINYHPDA